MTRKLRLIGKGWEKFTGNIGVVAFQDGLSTGAVHQMDAHRLTCTIGARWEDGTPSSVGEGYEASKNKPAPVIDKSAAQAPAEQGATAVDAGKTYTAEELAAVADAKGIAGLREIAEPLKIKAGSIKALIEAILKVAGAPADEAAAESEQA